jgi:hypothetical protein
MIDAVIKTLDKYIDKIIKFKEIKAKFMKDIS